jgi:choline transport protein
VSLGWVSYVTLTSFTAATTIQGLAVLNHPGYVPQPWHASLLTWGVVSFGFFFNTVLAPRLPAVEVIFFVLHIVGWFGIFVTLLVMGPRHNAVDTFTHFYDGGNWGSVGLSGIITMMNSSAMLVGYESPVHMCMSCRSYSLVDHANECTAEETENASRVMPRVITWSIVMNALMVIALAAVYVTVIDDLDTTLATPLGVVFLQVFYDVTQSKAGTTVMAAIVVVELISACIAEGACASRQMVSR